MSWPAFGSVVLADVPGDLLEHVLRVAAEGYVVRPDPLASGSDAAGPEAGLDRLDDAEAPTRGGSAPSLTPRESEVLALLADGASNKVIARRLEISPSTAKFHVASLLGKLGARSRLDAVAIGMRLGLVLL
jgi:DNA-binding NarL/FixJ family response regulator